MPEPKTPHDALFKWTFSQIEHAQAELRAILPSGLLASVDLATLRVCPGEFVDAALSASHSDLLYRVQIQGRPGFLYILFEHQSTEDELMPLRLLGYLVRILELEARTRESEDEPMLPLPLVLPVVLHHSEKGWRRASRFEELFDSELLARPDIAEFFPRFGFVLEDLSQVSDEALRQRALDQVTRLTLWALRDARKPARLLATAKGWVKAMQDLLSAPSGVDALRVIFRYISLVTEEHTAERVLEIVLAEAPIIEETMTTLAERWKAEGEAKGRTEGEAKGRTEGEAKGRTEGEAKGRTEGEAKGRAEGRRSVLVQLLTLKFGALPELAHARIAAGTETDLERWTERVLSASSADGVFGG